MKVKKEILLSADEYLFTNIHKSEDEQRGRPGSGAYFLICHAVYGIEIILISLQTTVDTAIHYLLWLRTLKPLLLAYCCLKI